MSTTTKNETEQLMITALNILAIRPQSTWELRYKLTRTVQKSNANLQEQQKLLDTVIDTLAKQEYIDDTAFAKWYCEQRLSFRPRSKRRLSVELSRKGLNRQTISTALDTYDERLACSTLIQKKKSLKKEKLISYLQREGFSWDTITNTLEYTQ